MAKMADPTEFKDSTSFPVLLKMTAMADPAGSGDSTSVSALLKMEKRAAPPEVIETTSVPVLFLIHNRCEAEGRIFSGYAGELGLDPVVFPDPDSFLSWYNEKFPLSDSIRMNFPAWASRAHLVAVLRSVRKRPNLSCLYDASPRIVAGLRSGKTGITAERVAQMLLSRLGPGRDRVGLLRIHHDSLKRRFLNLLQERFERSDTQPIYAPDKPNWKKAQGMERRVWDDSRLVGSKIKTFFTSCPFCLSTGIRVIPWSSPISTWVEMAGNAGWKAYCPICKEVLYFNIVAMN
jgi:hypothetical protein